MMMIADNGHDDDDDDVDDNGPSIRDLRQDPST